MSAFMAWIDTLDVLGWWLLVAIVVGLIAHAFCRAAARADEDEEWRGRLEEENERLWDSEMEAIDIIHDTKGETLVAQAKIDAALALAEERSLLTTSASVIGEMVKVLKGER